MKALVDKMCNRMRKLLGGKSAETDRGTEIAHGIWVDPGQPMPTFYPKEVIFCGVIFQQTGNDSFRYEIPSDSIASIAKIGVRFDDLFEIGKKEIEWLRMVENNMHQILHTLVSEWVNYAEGRQQEDFVDKAKNIEIAYTTEDPEEFDSVDDLEWSIAAEIDHYTFYVEMRALQPFGSGTVY